MTAGVNISMSLRFQIARWHAMDAMSAQKCGQYMYASTNMSTFVNPFADSLTLNSLGAHASFKGFPKLGPKLGLPI